MTPRLILTRTKQQQSATFGNLEISGPVFKHFVTLESSAKIFPAGTYDLVYEHSNRFKRQLWEFKGIPHRAEIKIHNANFAHQLDGCVAIGMRSGVINGIPAALSSRLALEQLTEALRPYQGLTLKIEVIDLIGED